MTLSQSNNRNDELEIGVVALIMMYSTGLVALFLAGTAAKYTHTSQRTTTDPVGPNSYQVTFETNIVDSSGLSMPPIVIQVTREWAPLGSDRFYALVQDNFYDDAAFFRGKRLYLRTILFWSWRCSRHFQLVTTPVRVILW